VPGRLASTFGTCFVTGSIATDSDTVIGSACERGRFSASICACSLRSFSLPSSFSARCHFICTTGTRQRLTRQAAAALSPSSCGSTSASRSSAVKKLRGPRTAITPTAPAFTRRSTFVLRLPP
jgi:hypothetical protein